MTYIKYKTRVKPYFARVKRQTLLTRVLFKARKFTFKKSKAKCYRLTKLPIKIANFSSWWND